jgi:DNA-binding IclR family transcriptional regulator
MAIQSVQRAMRILGLFSVAQPRLGITEISNALSLHKATIQGLIRTLFDEGFLAQDPATKKYELGLKIYEMGVVLAGTLEINQKSAEPAHRLALKTKLLVRICIRDGHTAIITLDAFPRTQPFLVRQLGIRFPLYCTALGKALLAFLPPKELSEYIKNTQLTAYTVDTITHKHDLLKNLEEVRNLGYSVNRQEHLLARSGIGAPIFNGSGRVEASIALVGDPARLLGKEKEVLARMVMSTASEISQAMGCFPHPGSAITELINKKSIPCMQCRTIV